MNKDLDIGLLAEVVGGHVGIEIVRSERATTFSTDGKRLIIPATIAGDEVTRDILIGGVAHEAAGHIYSSDFDALERWENNTPLTKGLANIVEDIRIEKAAMRRFPGTKKILGKMVEALVQREFFGQPTEESHPAEILRTWLLRTLRKEKLGQSIDDTIAKNLAVQCFGEKRCRRLLATAIAGAESDSTQMVLKTAEKLAKMIAEPDEEDEDPSPPNQEPPPPPEIGEQEDNQNGAGGQQDQSGQPDRSQPDQGKAGSQPGQGTDQPGGDQGASANTDAKKRQENAQKALKATEKEVGPTELSEILGEVMNETGAGQGRSQALSKYEVKTPCPLSPSSLASALASRLRGSMDQLLQARLEEEDLGDAEHGMLNHRSITRAFLGDKRIFQIDGEEAEGLSTAIHIVLDMSSSMRSGGNDEITKSILYAMAGAMGGYETQGIAFAISAFNTNLMQIKGFNEPWANAKQRLGHYNPRGGTMTTATLRETLPELCLRKEARKVLFLVTDGDVGNAEENKRLIKAAREHGVEVDVVMLGDQIALRHKDHGFRTYAQVKSGDAGAIQRAIFSVLTNAI